MNRWTHLYLFSLVYGWSTGGYWDDSGWAWTLLGLLLEPPIRLGGNG